MSSIDINKLIQESISNRPVNENGNDPEAGLENALVGEGVLDNTIKGIAKTTGDYWGPKLKGVAKTTGDYWGPKLNKATNFVKDQVDAREKLASQSGVGGSLKHAGNELLAGARKHYGTTAAIGAGALGAGYAAKKYLQRRKAKKTGK